MVELRKRPPPKEPLAPAPAAKKGRASSSKAAAKPKTDESVAKKAKKAATKVKQVVAGPTATSGDDASTAQQPSVGDEGIKTGEAGMIPETAGTAPSTTTVPGADVSSGSGTGTTNTAAAEALHRPPTSSQGLAVREAAGEKAVDAGPAGFDAFAATAGSAPPLAAPTEAVATDPAAAGTAAGNGGDTGVVDKDTATPAPADLENPTQVGKTDTTTPVTAAEPATLPLSLSSVGKRIDLAVFNMEIETHTGTKTTIPQLLDGAAGLVLFTYPKASTPGCTTQVCMFRDNYDAFTAPIAATGSGYKIFGLSTDSTKANTTFATKQKIQYELLCDPAAGLTGAIGMKKAGNAKGTVRGVVVLDGSGVVRIWEQGGPARTVEVVKEFLGGVRD